MEQEGVMDYSLLVGIHFREADSTEDQTSSGSGTPIGWFSLHLNHNNNSSVSICLSYFHLFQLVADNGGSENETFARVSRADMDQLLLDQEG